MSFKKKAKPSKKKSKGKKDDWTFEGGQSIEATKTEVDEPGKRKRRETQDKDERQRRGRAKIDDRIKKRQLVKKMSKKIKFSDVLDKEEKVDDEVLKPPPKIVRLNPLSVSDRLQLFISKSLDASEAQSEDEQNTSEESDENSENGDESENENDSEDPSTETKEKKRINTIATRTSDREVHDDDNQVIEDDFINKENEYYDWFFSSKPSGNGSLSRALKPLNTCGSDEIYGRLHPHIQNLPSAINSFGDVPGVHKLWRDKDTLELDEVGSKLMPYLNVFADTLIEGRDHHNDSSILDTFLMHTVAHVVKSRAKVIKHNEKLKKRINDAKLQKALSEVNNPKENKKKNKRATEAVTPIPSVSNSNLSLDDTQESEEVMQDQGYNRPRVLILCPFRGTAVQIIQSLQNILGENTSISGMEKLEDDFSPPDENENDDADFMDSKDGNKKNREKKGPAEKPEDWKALFNQNIDDDFKMGIQLNPGHGKGSGADKGVYVRLFSDFFISDIILASPIGLRLAIEGGGSNTSKGIKQSSSVGDFLSSIEIVMLHQADVLYMQNWDHVDYIMKHTNQLPLAQHDTDFSRVRPYFLDGLGANHRQLLINTQFVEPEIQALFREHGKSQSGCVRYKKNWSNGSLINVMNSVKQVFQLVPSITSFEEQEDIRFRYFKDTVLSQVLRLEQKHTLIVTPSYLNYVRIRNELMHQQASAVYVCEYSRDSEISRGRSRFFHGTKDIMLYSGRAHFFRRFQIKGARHLIFYSLPEYALFYSELVNMINVADNDDLGHSSPSCLVLYTPYEKMALERIVGKKRCDHMMSSKKATFMFC